MTATTTELRTLTQIRWETRRASAGVQAVQARNRAADTAWFAQILRNGADTAAYIEATVIADEWALIADERAGRRAAA
ncbi:hypothetical protein ACIBSV_47085 [Embleya sp. NPDC050154]|uniref:hypothetical protein n=1 Tax=Embleya sp. NPDC050154 TaxID=3363988 RepID=UPI0037B21215